MTSRLEFLTAKYSELSSLYKNPTRDLRGMAASDQDEVLVAKHAELLALFRDIDWDSEMPKSSPYFKVLALLYEVDDYCGRSPAVEAEILREPTASAEYFNTRRDNDLLEWRESDFSDPALRSLWKARVLCCVAAVESRRKSSDSNALLQELNILEDFVFRQLHRPAEDRPAWTALAFVYTAQARVARHGPDYSYVRDKLLSVVECLDERAIEIIEELSKRTKRLRDLNLQGKDLDPEMREIEELEDDLIFIREKATLAILFNVGLDSLQRGFLDGANQACQAARFQFRLHGQAGHRLRNEVLMIAIKRAQTSTTSTSEFLLLEAELENKILPRLDPARSIGNPKLYLYGLRELAVVQHLCGKPAEMRGTLRKMQESTPLGSQWKSRISLLHSRSLYGGWRHASGDYKDRDPQPLLDSLNHSEESFMHATGSSEGIGSHNDSRSLLAFIKNSGGRKLIDTMESLISYGTVQLFLKQYFDAVREPDKSAKAVGEAKKVAEAVKELSEDRNPRLLAMAHLLWADAYRESNFIVEARRHLEIAKALEAQIQHKYVEDRRKAIEEKIPTTLTLYRKDFSHLNQAEDVLLGWYIGTCEDKSNLSKIAKQLDISRNRLKSYIERQGSSSPYYYLLTAQTATKKRGRTK